MTMEKSGKIITLRAAGYSFDAIAKKVGVAKNTVMKICNEYEAIEEIKAQRRAILEEIFRTENLLLTDRLGSLARLLNRIRLEIDKRDLSVLTTESLVKLYFSTLKALTDQSPVMDTDDVRAESEEQYDLKKNMITLT